MLEDVDEVQMRKDFEAMVDDVALRLRGEAVQSTAAISMLRANMDSFIKGNRARADDSEYPFYTDSDEVSYKLHFFLGQDCENVFHPRARAGRQMRNSRLPSEDKQPQISYNLYQTTKSGRTRHGSKPWSCSVWTAPRAKEKH